MTNDEKKTENAKPEVPVWTAPSIEEIPKKWDWKEVGLDTFFLFAITSFNFGKNSFGEDKYIITAMQVNPNSDVVMGKQNYHFESNSRTVKKLFNEYFKDWKKQMIGTRVWMHMSTNQTEGLYIVKA